MCTLINVPIKDVLIWLNDQLKSSACGAIRMTCDGGNPISVAGGIYPDSLGLALQVLNYIAINYPLSQAYRTQEFISLFNAVREYCSISPYLLLGGAISHLDLEIIYNIIDEIAEYINQFRLLQARIKQVDEAELLLDFANQ